MAYLLIEKLNDGTDVVLLGPMEWRPRFFQSCLRDDLEIDFQVPLSNDNNEAIIVNEIARIIPVTDIGIMGEYNQKIHHLDGPYYNMSQLSAEVYHNVKDKPIEFVKDELKLILSANRYRYETMGIQLSIQSKIVVALTTREDRWLYLQAFQLGKDNINWNFGSEFLTLTNTELGQIVDGVVNHVQATFDWETLKIDELDSLSTFGELNVMTLVSDNSVWEPIPMSEPDVIG